MAIIPYGDAIDLWVRIFLFLLLKEFCFHSVFYFMFCIVRVWICK